MIRRCYTLIVVPLPLALSPSFFFTHPPTPAIYTLSLHDALPISHRPGPECVPRRRRLRAEHRSPPSLLGRGREEPRAARSEEHTSELQSPDHLVCRLLLEKKKKNHQPHQETQHTTNHPQLTT